MRKVFILYQNFYTPDGQKMSIGGIQTYIKMLVQVIKKLDMTPVIFQYANINFKNLYNGIEVHGIAMKPGWSKKRKNQVLFDKCMKQYNTQKDIIIFASETMSVKNNESRVIGIQHGITWDVRGHEHYSHQKNLLFIFWRAIKAYMMAKRLSNFKILIGVDYNFLNWFRTQVAYNETNIKVIPNCTKINPVVKKKEGIIKIIFARRFHEYRGTKLFAPVAKSIISKYDNVQITFAGTGPDEFYLKEMFSDNPQINFINYDSQKSLDIHAEYHIAVIPSVGSEGTSFSLLEAMASKCAVVATNVGGMTNIILDNYNGLLINPEEQELYDALEKMITDKNLREKLAENAYHTVIQAFNRDLWEERWTKVLEEICQ